MSLLEGEDELLPIARALREVPATRTIPPRTGHRWAMTGARGVKLETQMVGGKRMTTVKALRAFLTALNPVPSTEPEGPRSPAQRRAADDAAARELDKLGA